MMGESFEIKKAWKFSPDNVTLSNDRKVRYFSYFRRSDNP